MVLYAKLSKEVTPKTFFELAYAKAFAVETPILIPVNDPGPTEHANTSISLKEVWA